MQQIRTPFGMMPMTDEEYSRTYEGYMKSYESKDLEGLFNGSTRMLMSLTTIIELQQRVIEGLAGESVDPSGVAPEVENPEDAAGS